MPVPKRKRSRRRRDMRFANKGLKVASVTQCRNCQAPLPTHVACSTCGFYKGVKVFATKLDRTVTRGKEQQKKQASQAKRAPVQEPTE